MFKTEFKFPVMAIAIAITTMAVSSCNSHADKKEAMVEKWQKDTAKVNVPTAQTMLENGDVDQAREILEKCLKGDPDLIGANFLMGKVHFMQNRMDRAAEFFRKVIKIDRHLDQGWYWLGETAAKQGDHKDAIESYKKAMDINPSAAGYVVAIVDAYAAMEKYDQAVEFMAAKEKAFAGNSEFVIAHADILMRCGRKDDAIKVYQSGLLFNSDAVELMEGLGYCYMVEERWGDAVEIFEKLLAQETGNEQNGYLKMLSICSMNTGEYGRALGYLDRLDSENRDNAEFWLKSGQAALGAGQSKRAVACAKRALFLKAGWADATVLLGCGLYMDGEYKTAIETFADVIYNKKVSSFAWMMTGKCYQQLGDNSRAKKAFDKVETSQANTRMLGLLADAMEN